MYPPLKIRGDGGSYMKKCIDVTLSAPKLEGGNNNVKLKYEFLFSSYCCILGFASFP